MTTAITSGRYDPVTPGHICNILRIAKHPGCSKLKVYILDYPERRFSIDCTLQIFREVFDEMSELHDIEFIVNDAHFAEIKKGFFDFNHCGQDIVYFGGNHRVLRNIEELGFPVHYMERAYDYSARDIPLPD